MHLSYCAGKAAIDAAEASSARTLLLGSSQVTSSMSQPSKTLSEQRKERLLDESEEEKGGKNGDKNYIAVNKRTLGEGKIELDQGRLAEAIREERKRKARNEDDNDDSQARRKKYNSSLQGGKAGDNAEVTEEELGTYMKSHEINFIC